MEYRQSHPQYRELGIDEHLRLVEPEEKHAEASLSWVESPDVIQYMGADFSNPTLEGELNRIREVRNNRDEYSWMIELDGRVIGNVCINSINETSRKFGVKAGNLTVLIGAKDQWKKGIGARACTAVIAWAFMEAGFEAMGARALQENIASINTLKKLGFKEIGTEPYEGSMSGKPSVWRNFRTDSATRNTFLPAMRFHILTPLYEALVWPFMGRMWKRVAEEVSRRTPERGSVVDLGCGPGNVLWCIRKLRPDVHLIGMDIDPEIIHIAQGRSRGKNIAFSMASIDDTRLPDASTNVVVSTLMFHHLSTETKKAAFREARRILRPSGVFLLCDFSLPTKERRWLNVRWWKHFEPEIEPQLDGQLLELGKQELAHIETIFSVYGCISLHAFTFSSISEKR